MFALGGIDKPLIIFERGHVVAQVAAQFGPHQTMLGLLWREFEHHVQRTPRRRRLPGCLARAGQQHPRRPGSRIEVHQPCRQRLCAGRIAERGVGTVK